MLSRLPPLLRLPLLPRLLRLPLLPLVNTRLVNTRLVNSNFGWLRFFNYFSRKKGVMVVMFSKGQLPYQRFQKDSLPVSAILSLSKAVS